MKKFILTMTVILSASVLVFAESCSTVGSTDKKYTPQGDCDYKTETRTCCEDGNWSEWDKECPVSKKCKKWTINRKEETIICGTLPACHSGDSLKNIQNRCANHLKGNIETARNTNILGELSEDYCAHLESIPSAANSKVSFGSIKVEPVSGTEKPCSTQWGGTPNTSIDMRYSFPVIYTSCICAG